jgi:hypothetical protein
VRTHSGNPDLPQIDHNPVGIGKGKNFVAVFSSPQFDYETHHVFTGAADAELSGNAGFVERGHLKSRPEAAGGNVHKKAWRIF